MRIIFILLIISIISAVMSLRYKIKLRIKITDPHKNNFFLIRNMPWLTDLCPMRIKYVPADELENRKKANTALKIFYLSLITGFTLTSFIENSKSVKTYNPRLTYNSYDSTKPMTDSEKAQVLDSFKKDLQHTKGQ